jgi:opacity protein-like surface antigen
MNIKLLAAVMLVIAVPGVALAAPFGATEFGGAIGWNVVPENTEIGDAYHRSDVPASSPFLGGRLSFSLHERLTLEVDARYAAPEFRATAGDTSTSFSGPAKTLAWRGLVGVNLLTEGLVRPYLQVGGGAESLLADPKPGIFHDDTDSNAVFGLGARFELADWWGMRADLRYVLGPGKEPDGADPVFAHGFELGAAFYVRLLGTAGDRDKDGIPDRDDECPIAPEDKDGFQDKDGCPDRDNDLDGIPDVDDKCPNEPETRNGVLDDDGCPDGDSDGDGIDDAHDQCTDKPEDKDGFDDADGCPDPDNDGDGLLDVEDQCPNAAEDKDRWKDADGCPDPDNDGDGIEDSKDGCPNEPETKNGYLDEDGCPDDKPKTKKK